MAWKLDPAAEMRRMFTKAAVTRIVGLTTGAVALGPGMKVRLAAALKAVASILEKQAKAEMKPQLSKRKRKVTDDGVEFYLVPEEETPALDTKVAAQLLPQEKHPQAWTTSKSGGNVNITVGPLDEE